MTHNSYKRIKNWSCIQSNAFNSFLASAHKALWIWHCDSRIFQQCGNLENINNFNNSNY